MEKIIHGKLLYGLRIKNIPNGSVPQTGDKEALQLVSLKHPKGATLAAHMHRPTKRLTKRLQEGLVILKGKIRLDLYTDNKKFFKRLFLSEGQVYIAMKGGLCIHILHDAEILEFKNGPFVDDKVLIP